MAIESVGEYTIEIRKDTSTKNLYYYQVTVAMGEGKVETASGQALGYGQGMAMANDRAFEILERAGFVK